MPVVSAIVLFAVIWFLVLFCILPFVSRSQAQDGKIEPGTHASAPANFRPGRTAGLVSVVAVVVWAVICGIIISGAITVRDFDFMNRLPPETTDGTNG